MKGENKAIVRNENMNSVSNIFDLFDVDLKADRWHLRYLCCYFYFLSWQTKGPDLPFGQWEFHRLLTLHHFYTSCLSSLSIWLITSQHPLQVVHIWLLHFLWIYKLMIRIPLLLAKWQLIPNVFICFIFIFSPTSG